MVSIYRLHRHHPHRHRPRMIRERDNCAQHISHERADPSTASSIRASSGADVARATPVPAQMWEVCGVHARYAVWEVCEHGAMLAQVSQQGARWVYSRIRPEALGAEGSQACLSRAAKPTGGSRPSPAAAMEGSQRLRPTRASRTLQCPSLAHRDP